MINFVIITCVFDLQKSHFTRLCFFSTWVGTSIKGQAKAPIVLAIFQKLLLQKEVGQFNNA